MAKNELDRASENFKEKIDELKEKERRLNEINSRSSDFNERLDASLVRIKLEILEKLKAYDEIIDRHTNQINNIMTKQEVLTTEVQTAVKTVKVILTLGGALFTIVNVLVALYK